MLTETATKNSIFTHVLYNLYFGPPYYNFDRFNYGDEVITNKNIVQKSFNLAKYFKELSAVYD